MVERGLSGPTCVDVSAALALIAAVTLDATPAKTKTDLPATAFTKKSNQARGPGSHGRHLRSRGAGNGPDIRLVRHVSRPRVAGFS